MIVKTKIRFSCSDFWEDVTIDMSKFESKNEFDDQVFGWYQGEYISILKTTSINDVIKQRDKSSI